MSDQKTEEPAPPTTKHRSPNHPAVSLEKALEKASMLHEKARTSPVPVEVACQYMNVKATSSTGMRWLAALTEFGLAETEGRGKQKTLKVSERGRTLLKHPDKKSKEYADAMREAALAPKIHAKVWDLREDGLLPPDEALAYTLTGPDWGFSEPAAEAFIAQFRETIASAGLTEGAEQEETEEETQDKGLSGSGGDGRRNDGEAKWKATPMSDQATAKDIPLPLQSGGTAVLHLPYRLDEQDYEWVTGLLKGLKQSILKRTPADEPAQDGQEGAE